MLTPDEELQDRKGVNDRYDGWLQCSMCGHRYTAENNGDDKSPCCSADPMDLDQLIDSLWPEAT